MIYGLVFSGTNGAVVGKSLWRSLGKDLPARIPVGGFMNLFG